MRCHLIAAVFLSAALVPAQDAVYYDIPIADLSITAGELPERDETFAFSLWRSGCPIRVALDGGGDGYFEGDEGRWSTIDLRSGRIVVRRPGAGEFSGKILTKTGQVSFRSPAELEPVDAARFEDAKAAYLDELLQYGYAGTAWWRHQRGDAPIDGGPEAFGAVPRSDISQTYEMMSGGRALRENLQLERGLPGGERAAESVEISSVQGITIEEFDWAGYLEGATPDPDPLAATIPADQHALFFPSFQAMLDVLDMADSNGAPAVQIMEASAQDALTKQRYEQQLCLQANALSRLLGPQLIQSVAATGSDPFLREGTDLAILFEAKDADALDKLLTASRIAQASVRDTTTVETDIAGVVCQRITSVDRRVDSIQFRIGDTLVVTNSMTQARRIITAEQRMADLDEYRFFRSRYPRDGESAFLMITDGAIRRWCSPQWRIAMSRRVRAAAALATLDMENATALVSGEDLGTALPNDFALVDLGEVKLSEGGAHSSIYGGIDFLTPICEMALSHATEVEAQGYERWRRGYERNWSNVFDPIGVQLRVSEEEIFTDLTVMPLILGSDYREWIEAAGDSRIEPGAGHPHDGRLFQLIFAFDHKSQAGQELSGFMPPVPGAERSANPFAWIGDSISIAVDEGSLLAEAAAAEDPEELFEDNLPRLPLLAEIEVGNPLLAAVFLTGLRSLAENTAPGYTEWSTLDHGETKYVRIGAGKELDSEDAVKDFALHYATLKGTLLLGIDPDTFKAAIDRHQQEPDSPHVWLGEHLASRVRRDALQLLEAIYPDSGYRAELRRETYKNLPILNEWRRVFPDRDPLEVHQQLTGLRLVCAGGGEFRWNEEWRTYESTAFGHPGEQKHGPADCLPFPGWAWGEFGLTFEDDGMRARAAIRK